MAIVQGQWGHTVQFVMSQERYGSPWYSGSSVICDHARDHGFLGPKIAARESRQLLCSVDIACVSAAWFSSCHNLLGELVQPDVRGYPSGLVWVSTKQLAADAQQFPVPCGCHGAPRRAQDSNDLAHLPHNLEITLGWLSNRLAGMYGRCPGSGGIGRMHM